MSMLITEGRSERRSELDTKVGQILNRHPAVGLAVGIIGISTTLGLKRPSCSTIAMRSRP